MKLYVVKWEHGSRQYNEHARAVNHLRDLYEKTYYNATLTRVEYKDIGKAILSEYTKEFA